MELALYLAMKAEGQAGDHTTNCSNTQAAVELEAEFIALLVLFVFIQYCVSIYNGAGGGIKGWGEEGEGEKERVHIDKYYSFILDMIPIGRWVGVQGVQIVS